MTQKKETQKFDWKFVFHVSITILTILGTVNLAFSSQKNDIRDNLNENKLQEYKISVNTGKIEKVYNILERMDRKMDAILIREAENKGINQLNSSGNNG